LALKYHPAHPQPSHPPSLSHGSILNSKEIYLTFDDGPSELTPVVLDILYEYKIKGTFFVNGRKTNIGWDLYKRIVDEGHSIGNHTYSHDYSKIYTSEDSFVLDFKQLEDLLYEKVGVRPKIMRFPGGSNNTISKKCGSENLMKKLSESMKNMGYQYFDWNVDEYSDTLVHAFRKFSAALSG
jgi:peptidoglycan/xylan/chitin deacetylase (PgdA/CDA1 family)